MVQNILNLENEEKIDQLYYSITDKITPLERIHFEDILREAYAQTYVDSLSSTDRKLDKDSETQIIEIDGKKIKQINLKGDFNLLVHSTDSGFRGKKTLIDNSFSKLWHEISDTERHIVSACFITQDFLGHVPANGNGIMTVFTKSNNDEINLMGPSDINSHIKKYTFSSERNLYMSANNMPHNSRRVYNEIPIERRKPDYLLIFDDTPEEVIKNSYKAAAEFDVPVIFIDKREVEKNQLENLDNLTREFQETKDLKVLVTLVSTYETNVAGWLLNRMPNQVDDSLTQSINNERFRKDFDEREKVIYQVVESYLDECMRNGNTDNINQVISIMQNEIEKYNMINLGKTQISQIQMKFNAQAIIERVQQMSLQDVISEEKNNGRAQISAIDFCKLSMQIAGDESIGKDDVDLAERKLTQESEKEVSK